jgi:hypothetical protein
LTVARARLPGSTLWLDRLAWIEFFRVNLPSEISCLRSQLTNASWLTLIGELSDVVHLEAGDVLLRYLIVIILVGSVVFEVQVRLAACT